METQDHRHRGGPQGPRSVWEEEGDVEERVEEAKDRAWHLPVFKLQTSLFCKILVVARRGSSNDRVHPWGFGTRRGPSSGQEGFS